MIQKIRDLDSDERVMAGLAAVIVILLILVGFGIKAVSDANREWRAWCAAEGGVVLEDTTVKNTVSYDSKGNPVVGIASTTVQLCVVEGAVIDIRTT